MDQANELPKLKKELEWLKWPPSQSLQQTLKDLDQGFKNFFRRVKGGTEKPGFQNLKERAAQIVLGFLKLKKMQFGQIKKKEQFIFLKLAE